MRPSERRARIEQILHSYGATTVSEFARDLGVTPSTIRRDLSRLSDAGKVTRTYGGAVMSAEVAAEPTLHERQIQALPEKDAIGRWAAELVQTNETIILDAGTTTGRIAHHLRHTAKITVITNGLTALNALADATEIEVIVLGGDFRHISHSFVGPLTEVTLSRISADRAFLGADGLVAGKGICEASVAQTSVKEAMALRARELYVVVDSRKLGKGPFHAWTPLDRPWTLITDNGATDAQLGPFQELPNVSIVTIKLTGQEA